MSVVRHFSELKRPNNLEIGDIVDSAEELNLVSAERRNPSGVEEPIHVADPVAAAL